MSTNREPARRGQQTRMNVLELNARGRAFCLLFRCCTEDRFLSAVGMDGVHMSGCQIMFCQHSLGVCLA